MRLACVPGGFTIWVQLTSISGIMQKGKIEVTQLWVVAFTIQVE